MDSNSITHLPHRMGDLRKLETVMLNSNPIASLPDNMKNLKNLTALHLSGAHSSSTYTAVPLLSDLLLSKYWILLILLLLKKKWYFPIVLY